MLVHKASLDKFKKMEIILGLPWQSSGFKTLPSNGEGEDLIPGRGAKIPQASGPRTKK